MDEATQPQIKNPYKGPAFFTSEDEGIFHGRKQETRDLVSMVATDRVVFFYAPSGAGKTSLLNAGLIPQLRRKRYEVLPRSRVIGAPTVPPAVNNIYVYNAMLHLAEGEEQPERFYDLSLSDFLWHLSTKDGKRYFYDPSAEALRLATPREKLWPRVLVLDQFEELVTHYPTYWRHRADFFRQLDAALESDPMLRVILSLRSDYVQALDRWAGLLQSGRAARYHMLLLNKTGGLDAVTKPAENPGGRPYATDPETGESVAQALIDNLSQIREQDESGNLMVEDGEWVEPIQLQVVCEQLWDSLPPGDCITIENLTALARKSMDATADGAETQEGHEDAELAAFVDGALTTFYETRLRQALDKAPAEADSEELESDVRRLFSNRLITAAGTRGLVQRGSDVTDQIPESVITSLVDSHLLRSDRRGSVELLELIHDRFVEPIRQSNQRFDELRMAAFPWIADARKWYESGSTPETRSGALPQGAALETILAQVEGRHFETAAEEWIQAAKNKSQEVEIKRNRERSLIIGGVALALLVLALIAGWAALSARQQRDLAQESERKAAWNVEVSDSYFVEATRAKARADEEARKAENARRETERLRLTERSLSLANLSFDSADDEDRLLLARRAMSETTTLPATTALLQALDKGYRWNGTPASFVPLERLSAANEGPWRRIAFNQNGSLIALVNNTGEIQLWDNMTNRAISAMRPAHGEYSGPNYDLAFDPAHERLASVSGDRDNPTSPEHELILWNLTTPADPKPTVLAADQPSIWSVAFSPDGNHLAVGHQDGTVSLWDLSQTEPISRTLPGRHTDWAFAVAFDPSDPTGNRLASAGRDGAIILWSELSSTTPVSQTLTDHSAWINDVAFSPDGEKLASGSDDGTVRLWDLTEQRPTSRVLDNNSDAGAEPWQLAFSPDDGDKLAAAWGDELVRVYDLTKEDAAPLVLSGHSGEAWGVAFDPAKPQRLVSLSQYDPEPLAWDLSETSEFAHVQPLASPSASTQQAIALQALSQNGEWLARVDRDGTVYLTSPVGSSLPISFTAPLTATVVALSADGTRLALAGCAEGKSTANCQLQVLDPKATTTPIGAYSFAEPVQALAFHPTNAGELVVGLESGQVQSLNLQSVDPTNLPGSVPEIKDLAFDPDGNLLAGLGRTGQVVIWDWSGKEAIDEWQPPESGGSYNAVAFVRGADWLAIASTTPGTRPEVKLWERASWKPVTGLALGSERAADLAYDSVKRSLISLLTTETIDWPMDEATWYELACLRARRNLSYQAWLNAFPEEASYENAIICDYPLDASFAETRVKEAKKAIDVCSDDQVMEGLGILEEVASMTVDPPLHIEPRDEALRFLSEKALEHLRQPSAVYDEQARECLQTAASLLTNEQQRAFDPADALELGQNLVTAEAILASPQSTNLRQAADALESILGRPRSWPVELPPAQSMLTRTYYLLCQQGDAEYCRRLEAAAQFMAFGQTVSGVQEPGVEQPRFVLGKQGDLVSIYMDADPGTFDANIMLQGPNGFERTGEDSGSDFNDSQIELTLPHDGIYRILPGSWDGGSGEYRLALRGASPAELDVDRGQVIASNTQDRPIWFFEGAPSQAISMSLETADPGVDPILTLLQADGTMLQQVVGNDESEGARIAAAILPARGRYLVRTTQPYPPPSSTPYTLTVATLTPRVFDFGQPVTSSTSNDLLWAFEGQSGQAVVLTLATQDPAFDPQLALLRGDGSLLKENDNSDGELTARIRDVVLPADGTYFVRAGRPDSASPYELSLDEVTPAPLTDGPPVTATTDSSRLWQFPGRVGQFVRIDMTSADFDTYLELYDPNGKQVAVNDDFQGSDSRVGDLVLTSDGPYTIITRPLNEGASGAYEVTLTELTSRPITMAEAEEGTFATPTAWVFDGKPGQLLQINLEPTDDPTILPALKLLGPDGSEIARADNSGQSGAALPVVALSTPGLYAIVPSAQAPTGGYSLSLSTPATQPIELGQTEVRDLSEGIVWELAGQPGKRVSVRMEDAGDGIDSFLTVVEADGTQQMNDDGGGGYNSLLRLEPSSSRRIIVPKAYGGRTSGRYRLVVDEDVSP